MNSFVFLSLISFFICLPISDQNCSKEISDGCTTPYTVTDADVELARLYIQTRFVEEASIPPPLKPCPRLHVRRNFKCFSAEEKSRLLSALKTLYSSGRMWSLADTHAQCWHPWHKGVEGPTAHRWLMNQLELSLLAIDSDVTLPYWVTSEDCQRPHESSIWRTFGTSGTNATDYCVTDGPFTAQTQSRCLKRQWRHDGSISPWNCPEIEHFVYSLSLPLASIYFFTLGQHFHQHLNIGGWNGHYSDIWAPYDFVFHMHHNYYTECVLTRWQLSSPSNLVPLASYDQGWRIDPLTHARLPANLTSDVMCGTNGTRVLNTWFLGFGDQCFVCDQIVIAIKQLLSSNTSSSNSSVVSGSGLRAEQRTRARVRTRLGFGVDTRQKTPFDILPLVTPPASQCNPKCAPMPFPPPYMASANGRRQLEKMREWEVDLGLAMQSADLVMKSIIESFNAFQYCSPFIGQTLDQKRAKNGHKKRAKSQRMRDRVRD